MWKCPVCETEYGDVTVCPKCGFDGSCDYEEYPTVFAVTGAKSTRALRRDWEQKHGPSVNGRNKRCDVAITPEQAERGCRTTVAKKNFLVWLLILVAIVVFAFFYRTIKAPTVDCEISYEMVSNGEEYVRLAVAENAVIEERNLQELQQLLSKNSCNNLHIEGLNKRGRLGKSLLKRVSTLTGVENIEINYFNVVEGLDGLSDMTWVFFLTISDCDSVDLKGIYSLSGLNILNVNSIHQISNLPPLSDLTQLTSLEITNSCINDLTPLEGMTQLKNLSLSCNQINDLTPLAGLTQLQTLKISDNQISNLTPLAGLTQLYYLDISNNLISDLSPLTSLTGLRSLQIENNHLSSLTGLENLINLNSIFAFGNPLTDTSALKASGRTDALVMYKRNVS